MMAWGKTDKTDPAAIPAISANQGDGALTYSEAVDWAQRFLKGWTAVRSKGRAAGKRLSDARDWQALKGEVAGAAMLRNRPDEIVALACADRRYWDALRLGVANAIDRGDEIPPEALQWLSQYLRGEIERPHGIAGPDSAEGLHFGIWLAVFRLVQRGMKATRNDASAHESACDAVAQALGALELSPCTFHGVKKVWLTMQRQARNYASLQSDHVEPKSN